MPACCTSHVVQGYRPASLLNKTFAPLPLPLPLLQKRKRKINSSSYYDTEHKLSAQRIRCVDVLFQPGFTGKRASILFHDFMNVSPARMCFSLFLGTIGVSYGSLSVVGIVFSTSPPGTFHSARLSHQKEYKEIIKNAKRKLEVHLDVAVPCKKPNLLTGNWSDGQCIQQGSKNEVCLYPGRPQIVFELSLGRPE